MTETRYIYRTVESPEDKEAQRRALRRLIAVTAPGELGCTVCGHHGPRHEFGYGRGREYGEHPEHRVCPVCRRSIAWHGVIDGGQR